MKNELALLLAASNKRFHEDLHQIQSENGSLDFTGTGFGIMLDACDSDMVYQAAHEMDFLDLLEEYSASRVIENYVMNGSRVVSDSFISSYICSVVLLLERVISERVSSMKDELSRPVAV